MDDKMKHMVALADLEDIDEDGIPKDFSIFVLPFSSSLHLKGQDAYCACKDIHTAQGNVHFATFWTNEHFHITILLLSYRRKNGKRTKTAQGTYTYIWWAHALQLLVRPMISSTMNIKRRDEST